MSFISKIENAFSKEPMSEELFVFDTVGSTNDEARAFAEKNKGKDAFFIAREQTAGRGRRGRGFVSREGGLYISYLLHPTLSVGDSVMLTVFSAVALAEVIEDMTDAKVGIKWVNDLFLGGKKLAGILAEGGFSEDGKGFEYAVVGIGINLHGYALAPEIEGIATTLERECGKRVDIADFAKRLAKKLSEFEKRDRNDYMAGYRSRSVIVGGRVRMTSAGNEFFADILEIEDNGAIKVRLDSGEIKSFNSGEVSVIYNKT